ncbi:MAG: Smr/MutS family protein [Muribaculaceae bacterium]|nr:Smr/MutS family protein [Muribaculaceae bacterium]
MPHVYPSNFEAKIGFDAIRANIRERCQSVMGVEEVNEMAFSSDFRTVRQRLLETDEMKQIYVRGEEVPEVSFNDLSAWLTALKVPGSYASPEDFYRLRNSLRSFDSVRTRFLSREGKDEDSPLLYPSLATLFASIKLFPDLIRHIDRVIDKSGMVKDSASPELADVRQRLSAMQGSIARAIQRIFSAAVKDGIADKDTVPTLRDGRMVIPVAAANKRRLKGIVHDESATGKTAFIEPAETVELSNRLRELQLEEQRIIIRILTLLADEIRPFIDEIIASNLLLGKLDFIMAKARFALDVGGEMPSVNKNPEIDWYGAVHPVLLLSLRQQGREIVALNIRLEGNRRILLISGPNAGGKSVALKTVGMVQYMCQCGLLPTLHSNSHIGIFNKLFIDIGDEQSLENDLSTYSSHLKNMRYFLLHSDSRSLILIDEIGSGTEPNIGSSIAKAILVELGKSRSYGVVTTHYHNLKRFAEETPGFVNGAMLYDRQKLQPTFQLSIGNAGSSFAIEIATKIGLPRNVIEAAKQEVGEEYVESDKFLMEIARDRKYWQTKRANIKERESRLETLEQKYEKLISDLNQKRREILKEAQEEARQLLSGTNKRIENTIQEIRQAEAERERTKAIRKELEEFKQEVETYEEKTLKNEIKSRRDNRKSKGNAKNAKTAENAPKGSKPASGSRPTPGRSVAPKVEPLELREGAYVKMAGSNTVGEILAIQGKEAEVAFGQLRTRVKLSKLTPTAKPKSAGSSTGYSLLNSGTSEASRRRQLEFKDEVDIRGMRADEALDVVTHFVDDALQFGVKKVRILHGTGSGILRQIVRQQLSATPGIAKYQDEDVRLGGAGITVVDLI